MYYRDVKGIWVNFSLFFKSIGNPSNKHKDIIVRIMQLKEKTVYYATDLSNHLACGHLTQLGRKVALKELDPPSWIDSDLKILMERGTEHETAYLEHLKSIGNRVENLMGLGLAATIDAMQRGVDVIAQADLQVESWAGRSDFLVKVPGNSKFGQWTYEVQDTKLSQNTKAATILQLCLYTELLSSIQGAVPEQMHVVHTGENFPKETYRFADFQAYYRLNRKRFEEALNSSPLQTYPEPTSHCAICIWWKLCDKIRHDDDHLSLVAGILSSQTEELIGQGLNTMHKFAAAEKLEKPNRGNLKNLKKRQEQAQLQVRGKKEGLIREFLPIDKNKKKVDDEADDHGFNLLTERTEGDIYFDFEGDPFFEGGGIEYLFGYVFKDSTGTWLYQKHWATNRQEEKVAFQTFMNFVTERLKVFPDLCIYHYSHKEPTSFKRLMREHGIFEDAVNKLLRGFRFVDLRSVFKKSMMASVETYSLKALEEFANYKRLVPLEQAGPARREVELAINAHDYKKLTKELKEIVSKYNEDDCRATLALHDWIEIQRTEFERQGNILNRLKINDGEPSEESKKGREEIQKLADQLIHDLPEDRNTWNEEHRAKWLLSHLLFYFQREFDSGLWEYFAALDKEPEDLVEARNVITDLVFHETLPIKKKNETPIEIYSYPEQEVGIKEGEVLRDFASKKEIGTVDQIDHEKGIVHIKRRKSNSEIRPDIVISFPTSRTAALFKSLVNFAEDIVANGLSKKCTFKAGADLLMKHKPWFTKIIDCPLPKYDKDLVKSATSLSKLLDNSVLPLQGPPGTGKTHTGAEMILELVKEKKKIGVTAVSHKAYQNLLLKVKHLADERNLTVKLGYKGKEGSDAVAGLTLLDLEKDDLSKALDEGYVVGGTAWLWATEYAKQKLDYLFVDEAGQMSLAYVLAIAKCAKNLILLGDPNQLEQPQKGTHPEGSDVAALAHILDGKVTMPEDRGIFMNTTWRLHPDICAFTSELFYEGKLHSAEGLEKQVIAGNTRFKGSGLFYVPVFHHGNQTKSQEEIDEIKKITQDLMANGTYMNKKIETDDILIIAPYNNQVNALKQTLPKFKIGTVDKFQGQEAPVVIYSMTSSTVEDTPRGMGFLFDPNRLNVATSRAKSVCILVVSPKLLEPECNTIEQMKWANGLCRFVELTHMTN